MNLILCHSDDTEAIWLYMELQKKGAQIQLIAPEQLMMAEEWTQFIETETDSFKIHLKNQIAINSGESHFIFNRTRHAYSPLWAKASEKEKNYVSAEMNAMFMGWLYQLQLQNPIYNPSVGYSLSGVSWSNEQWTKAAYSAGFAEVEIKNPDFSYHTILVVGDEVISNGFSQKTIDNAHALSAISETPFLQIALNSTGEQFQGAETFPALRPYGNKLVHLIQNKLYER